MSNKTSLLDLIYQSQSSKETTANNLFDAASPAMLFGRRASLCSGLNWFYYGGYMLVDGVLTAIANNAAALALTASSNNYIEATRAGVVSANTTVRVIIIAATIAATEWIRLSQYGTYIATPISATP